MQRMVQSRANEPVAHAVPEVAACHRGGYAAREAACRSGRRGAPRHATTDHIFFSNLYLQTLQSPILNSSPFLTN